MLTTRLFCILLILINNWNVLIATEQYACEKLVWELGDNQLHMKITKDGLQSQESSFGTPIWSQINYIGLSRNISIYNDTEIIISNFESFCLGRHSCEEKIMKYNQYLYSTNTTAMTDKNPTVYLSNTSTATCTKFRAFNNTRSNIVCSKYEFIVNSYRSDSTSWFNMSGTLLLTSTKTIVSGKHNYDNIPLVYFLGDKQYLNPYFIFQFRNPASGYVPIIVNSDYGEFTIGDLLYENSLIVEIAGQNSSKPVVSFERNIGNITTKYNYVCMDRVSSENIPTSSTSLPPLSSLALKFVLKYYFLDIAKIIRQISSTENTFEIYLEASDRTSIVSNKSYTKCASYMADLVFLVSESKSNIVCYTGIIIFGNFVGGTSTLCLLILLFIHWTRFM